MNVKHRTYMRMNPKTGALTSGLPDLDAITHYQMVDKFDSPYTDLVELIPTPGGFGRAPDVIAVIRRVPWPTNKEQA